MTTLDLQELRAWLEEPLAIQLAASGVGPAPQSVRGFGVRLDNDDTLRVGLIDAQAPHLLAALRQAGKVAVNLTHPITFRGRQLKGPLVEIEEPSAEAAQAAQLYFARFVVALAKIGLTSEQCRGLFHTSATRWIRVRPEQLFDQTPGVGAGARLSA
jgi:hypothetical protein